MASSRDILARGVKNRWMLYIASMAGANVFAGVIAAVLLLWVLPIPRDAQVSDRGDVIFLTALTYLVAGAVISVGTAIVLLSPLTRWRRRGGPPTTAEQSAVMLLPLRQSLVHTAVWLIGSLAFIAYNYSDTPNLAITGGIVLALVSVGTFGASYMLGERILRPVAARALSDAEYAPQYAPPISMRLLLTWGLGTLVPTIGLLTLAIGQITGWVDATSTTFAAAVIAMCVLTGLTSLVLTLLTSSHLSDPVRQLRAALLDVRNDVRDTRVNVYDGSELGMLQVGFNRMVTAVDERRRLRTLFGKHVGDDVARLALENGTELGGETRFVAVLFVDMIASTRMAAARPPTEVVDLLNRFFEVIVEVVHRHGGFINKFIGDEVFAVFGAPLEMPDPCTATLRAARRMHTELVRRTGIDAGIGVSSGVCVAGNVGAAERLEYTVIGDAVNEAARLTELAKIHPSRVFAAQHTVTAACAEERAQWTAGRSLVLRGRRMPTGIAYPADAPTAADGSEPGAGGVDGDAAGDEAEAHSAVADDPGPATEPRYRPRPDETA
ncbi:adenylate/guanylate cyclase domain-containing protein [Tomitella fengzijianii]|uniref:adenylate/guanylate cyclase domain-containing protein n=1 Tax=Tomitella fengzijianii TaxID=2597660 RepID=UPI001E5BA2FF|nr:adenylate/guanylate cyclase domain-containing protein [Tomitella fengzijianii]